MATIQAGVGVELTKGGAIKVDDFSKTTVDGVWAIGDVTDRVNLTPVALMVSGGFRIKRLALLFFFELFVWSLSRRCHGLHKCDGHCSSGVYSC